MQTVSSISMNPRMWRNKTTVRNVLSQNIIARREARDLTALELALLAGVSRTQIHYVERRLKSATVDLIAAIAAALKCEPWQLLLSRRLARKIDRAGISPDGAISRRRAGHTRRSRGL